MDIDAFPFCCTAKVIVDLGGTETAEDGYRSYTEQEFKEDLQDELSRVKREGNALAVAATTTEQEEANQWLKEEGWLCAGPYAKNRHSDTGLFLWWYPCKGVFGEEG